MEQIYHDDQHGGTTKHKKDTKALQNIYTALNNYNYTKAIKLCSTTKTIVDWPITRALKAHALERSSKKDEALQELLNLLGWKSFQDHDDEEKEKEDEHSNEAAKATKQQVEHVPTRQKHHHGITDETTLNTIAATLRAYQLYTAVIRLYTESVMACDELKPTKLSATTSSSQTQTQRQQFIETYHSSLKALFQAHVRRLSSISHPFLCDVVFEFHKNKTYTTTSDVKEEEISSSSSSLPGVEELDWLFLRLFEDSPMMKQQQQQQQRKKLSPKSQVLVEQDKNDYSSSSSYPKQQNIDFYYQVIGYYEALQTTSMQLARNITLPKQSSLYWSWAVWSILLHYQAVLVAVKIMVTHHKQENDDDDIQLPLSLKQKCQILPALAENLCRTKIIQPNNITKLRPPSGEDWKLYIRTLFVKGTSNHKNSVQDVYTEISNLLQNQVPTTNHDSSNSSKTSSNEIHDEHDMLEAQGSILPMSPRDKMELLTLMERFKGQWSFESHCQTLLSGSTTEDERNGSGATAPPQWSFWVGLIQSTAAAAAAAATDTNNSSSSSNMMDEPLQKCQILIQDELITKQHTGSRNRGPFLLLVELAATPVRYQLSQFLQQKKEESNDSSMDELCIRLTTLQQSMSDYISLFCGSHDHGYHLSFTSRPSCVYRDVRPYLVLLTRGWKLIYNMKKDTVVVSQQVNQWLSSLGDFLASKNIPFSSSSSEPEEDTTTNLKETKQQLTTYTTICQLVNETCFLIKNIFPHLLSSHKNDMLRVVQSFCTIPSMLNIWMKTLCVNEWKIVPTSLDDHDGGSASSRRQIKKQQQQYDSSKQPTEGQKEGLPGDDLLVLIAHVLLREALVVSSKQSSRGIFASHVLTILTLLNLGKQMSPYNAAIKICMIRASSVLNVGTMIAKVGSEELNLRKIQHESCSYLLLKGCLRSGMFQTLSNQCMELLNLHRSCASDTPTFLMEAISQGNVGIGLDMLHFQASHMNASCQILEAKSMILDIAPLVGLIVDDDDSKEDESSVKRAIVKPDKHNNKKTMLIGNMHGIIGGQHDTETDLSRTIQMLQDSNDIYSSPSILNQVLVAEETPSSRQQQQQPDNNNNSNHDKHPIVLRQPHSHSSTTISNSHSSCNEDGSTFWSDNRDFDILDYELEELDWDNVDTAVAAKDEASSFTTTSSPYAFLIRPTSREDMVRSSFETAHLHGLLIHTVRLKQCYLEDSKSRGFGGAGGTGGGGKGGGGGKKNKHNKHAAHKQRGKGSTNTTGNRGSNDSSSSLDRDQQMKCVLESFQNQLQLANTFYNGVVVNNEEEEEDETKLCHTLFSVGLTISKVFVSSMQILVATTSSSSSDEQQKTQLLVSPICQLLTQAKKQMVHMGQEVNQSLLNGILELQSISCSTSASNDEQQPQLPNNNDTPRTTIDLLDPKTLAIVGTIIPRRLVFLLVLTRQLKFVLSSMIATKKKTNVVVNQDITSTSATTLSVVERQNEELLDVFNTFCSSVHSFVTILENKISQKFDTTTENTSPTTTLVGPYHDTLKQLFDDDTTSASLLGAVQCNSSNSSTNNTCWEDLYKDTYHKVQHSHSKSRAIMLTALHEISMSFESILPFQHQ